MSVRDTAFAEGTKTHYSVCCNSVTLCHIFEYDEEKAKSRKQKRKAKKMFNVLKNLKNDLDDTISSIENEWGDDSRKDYLFHEITGVKKAINIVKQAQSKELLELDRWAQTEMRKESNFKEAPRIGRTLSD